MFVTIKKHKLEARRKKLIRSLFKCDPWVSGSIAVIERICGSKGCACRHNGPKHPAMYLMWKDDQKTRALYIPRLLEAEVRKWSQNYRKVKDIMKKITEVQRQIISLR